MPRVRALQPSLYRTVKVVMHDGSTFRIPAAIRMVGDHLVLDRDPSNHPLYQGLSDQSGLLSRREEARLQKVEQRKKTEFFGDDEEDWDGK